MVLTASQFESLNADTVGLRSAGSTASTASRLSRCTFNMRPTLSNALMAPSRSMRMSSSLRRLHSSSHDTRFAISWVLDSNTVSIIRNLFARREDPVSVTSTMASASSGGLTSVAPQLNSTLARTPFFSR
ncbi:MAG: hypothetical protein BWY79_01739 [Actinobacteria bacterium ADurb.Bin444]|nr:MAG: hypothetical protein BWY79_01739 [Actinobacteria bacterium ADurb.Bin444]